MHQREQELQLLLGISQAATLVRQPADLGQLIGTRLQPVFSFSRAVAHGLAGGVGTQPLVSFMPPVAAHEPPAGASQTVPDEELVEAWLERLPTPRRVPLSERLALLPRHPHLQYLREAGLTDSLGAVLRHENQPVGLLWLHYPAGQAPEPLLPLLEAVAGLLAGAVANLAAHEEARARAEEKATQLAIVDALVLARSREELSQALARELGRILPYHYFTLRLLEPPSPDPWFCVLHLLPTGDVQDVRAEWEAAFADSGALLRAPMQGRPIKPEILNGDDFRRVREQVAVSRFAHEYAGVNSLLRAPVLLPDHTKGLLVLGSQWHAGFTEADLALVLRLVPQMALALENLLGRERIQALTQQLEQEKTYLMEEVQARHPFGEIIGSGHSLLPVLRQVEQVAPTSATVLLLGETGTGKELIARALHDRSPRRARPLIKVNCAALPSALIESELFGHEKGAFTGAVERRLGKFELADGGTIFLDEVGELPLELQAKLLRVLQEHEIERLGGQAVRTVDVRVVAATNRDLSQEIAAGRFRADLYYRLSVFPIVLPPLRDRREDIPLLADHFARRYCCELGKPFAGIRESAMRQLVRYGWPGNIRELQNLVEQAAIVCAGPLEWSRLLPAGPVPMAPELQAWPHVPEAATAYPAPAPAAGSAEGVPAAPTSLKDQEREHILAVLRQTRGRVRGAGGAAQLLDINPTTLESRLKRLGIDKKAIFG